MRLQQLFTAAALVSLSSAWPWPPAFGGEDVQMIDNLVRRQNNDNSPAQTATPGTGTGTGTIQPTRTGGSNSNAQSGSATISGGRSSQTSGGSRSSNGNSTSTEDEEFDPRDPAGGISMITPAATAGPQFYKIGDWVHFAWNYTSLSVTPSAINVLASCSANQATYTIAANMSAGPTGEVFWDTGAYQKSAQVPLLTNQYTLIVHDAGQAVNARPRPGYLGSFNQFTFGMYTPQPYTPWADYRCPTCLGSAANSLERMTFTFLAGICGITVLTFTYFFNNFNIV